MILSVSKELRRARKYLFWVETLGSIDFPLEYTSLITPHLYYFNFPMNLNHYFDRHVCPSFRPSVSYSFRKSMLYPLINGFSFCPIRPPFSRKSSTNDISFERSNTELSEFMKKLDVASSWCWPRPIY